MTNATIVRAWKDTEFRATLAPGAVPAHPSGSGAVRLDSLTALQGTGSPQCTLGGRTCGD